MPYILPDSGGASRCWRIPVSSFCRHSGLAAVWQNPECHPPSLPGCESSRSRRGGRLHGNDDWVSDNYLEDLLSKACDNGIVEANVKDVDEQTREESEQHFLSRAYKNYQPEKESSRFANRSFFSSACCKLLPKNCINGQRFDTNIKRGEDSIFMYGISWKVKHVKVATPNCIYYVRKRHNSAGRRNISIVTRLYEFLSQSSKYTNMYFRHLTHNDPLFYISRIAGTFYNKLIQQH